MGILADNNFGDTRSGGLAGPMGLLLIIVLATITVLLIRNMSKRIKRLPSTFDAGSDLPEAPDAAAHLRSDAGSRGRAGDQEIVEHVKGAQENLP